MELKRFKEKNHKKTGIIIFSICSVLLISGVFLYKSFASYLVTETKNVISGEIGSLGDLSFNFYVDNVLSLNAPDKSSGKIFDKDSSHCVNMEGETNQKNDVIVSWDYEAWAPKLSNLSSDRIKCFVHFKSEYNESLLNGAYPVLADGLIPVTIEGDGTVTKADLKTEWYKYEDKRWANAVILADESITYNNGDTIPESNIESYFVWIPRYRYQIFNTGEYTAADTTYKTSSTLNNAQIINIEFETKDKVLSEGTQVGEWLSHPAFTAFDTNGMWVGKFETGTTLTSDYNVRNGEAVQIKPNISSWRNIQVANAFYTTYDYKRELESHMMKNTEWGAVAYLTWSNYGLGTTDIRMNNNENYITGYAAVNAPTCGYTNNNVPCNNYGFTENITVSYNTLTGYQASCTGNISGIYDLSGGAWEYVMGAMKDTIGNLTSGRNDIRNGNFIGTLTYPNDGSDTTKTSWTASDGGVEWPDKRYYDLYTYSISDQQYGRRILGDATGELGPFETVTYTGTTISGSISSSTMYLSSWYVDFADFVNYSVPWFTRGGDMAGGLAAGLGAFNRVDGNGSEYRGFRIVLSQ